METQGPDAEASLRARRVRFEESGQEQATQTVEGNVQGRKVRISNRCIGLTLTVSMVGASMLGALSTHWLHSRMGCSPEDYDYGCAATRDAFNFSLIAAGASGVLGLAACKVKFLAEGLGKVGEKLLFVDH